MGNPYEKNNKEIPEISAEQDGVQLVPDKSLTFGNIAFIEREARASRAAHRKPRI